VDWIHLAQDMEDWLTSWATISFSRRTLLHAVSYL